MLTQELDNFIEWYKGRVQRTKGKLPAQSTLKTKRSRLNVVCDTAGLQELVVLGTIASDRDQLDALLDKLSLRMTSGAMRHCVDVIRDFVPYAVAQGWCSGSVLTKEDTPPRNPQKPITVYTVDELDMLIAGARGKSLRFWAFLATLAETGRRVGETLALRWEYLRLDLDIPCFDLQTTKNGKQQYVPLTKMLRDEVFTPENVEVLRGSGTGRFKTGDPQERPFPWSYSSIEKMFKRHCQRLGIHDRGFHNFRHTRATSLLSRGVPMQAVSAFLGHASVATTARVYDHATALSYSQYIDS